VVTTFPGLWVSISSPWLRVHCFRRIDTAVTKKLLLTLRPGQFVGKFGRRKCWTAGAAWMFMCFMVFASVGKFGKHNASGNPAQTEGYILIIFSCLFIAAFASTWGELPRTLDLNSADAVIDYMGLD
jgi:hypothetical protein